MPAAAKIKQCVFIIHELLERLASLAKEVDDDTEITDRIHKFYGEVLFNFLFRFEDSYTKFYSVLKIPESEARAFIAKQDSAKTNSTNTTKEHVNT